MCYATPLRKVTNCKQHTRTESSFYVFKHNCRFMQSTHDNGMKQPLVNLTRSYPKQLLVQWTRSSYSKIYRDHFWSNGPDVIFFCLLKNCIRDSSYYFASFGRGISDEMKLCYADDIGVWSSGLNVCNFRRILLSLLFTVSQGVCVSVELCRNLADACIYKDFYISRHLKK